MCSFNCYMQLLFNGLLSHMLRDFDVQICPLALMLPEMECEDSSCGPWFTTSTSMVLSYFSGWSIGCWTWLSSAVSLCSAVQGSRQDLPLTLTFFCLGGLAHLSMHSFWCFPGALALFYIHPHYCHPFEAMEQKYFANKHSFHQNGSCVKCMFYYINILTSLHFI